MFVSSQCDGHKINLPSLQGIVVLNIARLESIKDVTSILNVLGSIKSGDHLFLSETLSPLCLILL